MSEQLCIKDPFDDHGDGVIKVATLKIETEYDVFQIYIDRCGLYGINFYLDRNAKYRQTDDIRQNHLNSMSFDEIVTLHQMLGDVINEKRAEAPSPDPDISAAFIVSSVGDNFYLWAKQTYDEGDYTNLNHRLLLTDLYNDFLLKYPSARNCTRQSFISKLRTWCSMSGYKFNPHLFTKDRDLEGGKEYITIGNEKKGGQP